jgi:transposase
MGHIQEGDRMQSRIMCLDDMVGKKAMVRVIDKFMGTLDLTELGFLNTVPSARGRSSYSPLTLAKLYVYCYEEGIRSSRRIEKACLTNIEAMWLTGGLAPDFKTIADFRRDNIEALTSLFYEFASFAESAGLYGKKLVAIDGTKIRASNSKRRNISKKSLERRMDHYRAKIALYFHQLDDEDDIEAIEELSEKVRTAEESLDEAALLLKRMEDEGVTELSLTDKDARCMGKGRQGMQVAYNVQTAVDEKCHLIADLDITDRADDHGQLSAMAHRTQETMRKRDITFVADKGYYGTDDLQICKDAHIDCIVAPQGKSGNTNTSYYTVDNFSYDAKSDTYTCPKGACLSCRSRPDTQKRIYANKKACLSCSALDECKSTGFLYRRVTRRPGNDILDWADARYRDNTGLYSLRQQMVEHPFGTVKRSMGGDHFLLRGTKKVRCEAALLFTGYNLKRTLNVLGFDVMMEKLDAYAALIGSAATFSSLFLALLTPFQVFFGVKGRFCKALAAITSPKASRAGSCLA